MQKQKRAYWHTHDVDRPCVDTGAGFDRYGPAYSHGVEGLLRHQGCSFDEVEDQLARERAVSNHGSTLAWERARPATRDAWERLGSDVRD